MKQLLLLVNFGLIYFATYSIKGMPITTKDGNTVSSPAAIVFELSATDEHVNVMGNAMPKMPSFPATKKKPGKVCGFVKDAAGKPLQDAHIGIRSTAVGGYYSSAAADTDASGYYEITVPWGAAHFYCAGYTVDYGTGRAAMGLYAADGKIGSFASKDGEIENFVLFPYGIADKDDVSERAWYSNNYLGGAIHISYSTGKEGDMWAEKGSLPENGEIEITLTPDGEPMSGAEPQTFIIRKKLGNLNFNINNIPVGKYKIRATMKNGRELKMRTTGYNPQPQFGLKPTEAKGTATILFIPSGAKALSAIPNRGNWTSVDIRLGTE